MTTYKGAYASLEVEIKPKVILRSGHLYWQEHLYREEAFTISGYLGMQVLPGLPPRSAGSSPVLLSLHQVPLSSVLMSLSHSLWSAFLAKRNTRISLFQQLLLVALPFACFQLQNKKHMLKKVLWL